MDIKLQISYACFVIAGENAMLASVMGRNSARNETKQINATRKWARRREGRIAEMGDIQTGTKIESSGLALPSKRRRYGSIFRKSRIISKCSDRNRGRDSYLDQSSTRIT